MTANVGTVDRMIRFVRVFIILILIVTRTVHGALAIVLGIIGALLLITAFTRYCLLYTLLKTSTMKKPK
jgi:hypothetical protein